MHTEEGVNPRVRVSEMLRYLPAVVAVAASLLIAGWIGISLSLLILLPAAFSVLPIALRGGRVAYAIGAILVLLFMVVSGFTVGRLFWPVLAALALGILLGGESRR
jgi:hypothetical protein